jgi:predicted RNase H-like nuclease (RuvC/YqgF family)
MDDKELKKNLRNQEVIQDLLDDIKAKAKRIEELENKIDRLREIIGLAQKEL